MTKAFEGKVAIITGGASGMGRVTALAFAREGARVAIAGRRDDKGAETIAAIEAAGGEAIFVKTDVSKEADVLALVSRTVEHFGRLDFAFNNAGVFTDVGPITQSTDEVFDVTFNINVRGVMHCMKHQIPAMLATGGGVIINNASALGISPMPNAPVYNASKSAVIGLTRSAALEFSGQGIRLNALCPAVIETEMTEQIRNDPQARAYMLAKHPIGRFGQEEEIAATVLFLCSPGAGFITGAAIPVDGGATV